MRIGRRASERASRLRWRGVGGRIGKRLLLGIEIKSSCVGARTEKTFILAFTRWLIDLLNDTF
jgi:hypothetical protein